MWESIMCTTWDGNKQTQKQKKFKRRLKRTRSKREEEEETKRKVVGRLHLLHKVPLTKTTSLSALSFLFSCNTCLSKLSALHPMDTSLSTPTGHLHHIEVDEDPATNTFNSDMPSSSASGVATAASSRKKLRLGTRGRRLPPPPQTRWRSSTQEKIYRRRLLEALRSTATETSTTAGGAASRRPSSLRAVKEAADSALALTAGGRSRWSRSILKRRWRMRRLLLKAGGKVRGRGRRNKATRGSAAAGVLKGKKVRERLRVLSRLVPGCRKASTPTLLEEAADYVAALELQVKAMRALADTLSSATAASSIPPPPPVVAPAAAPGSPPS